ncbi:MAG: type II toxin-antitoxin system PemK/MazF family toxin [Lachnospiraceae bacterium]|nr:type II toxin-antitoxin system PemK/MazF family toxin [Lachnospiraceae bacterium]
MQPGLVKNWSYHRGDIYLADLGPYIGSEQGGVRPVLILQNDIGNFFSSTMIIAPMTTHLKRQDLPTHVLLQDVKGLSAESMVCLEQIDTIDKLRIIRYLGKISEEQMQKVEEGILQSVGIVIPECVEAP